MLDERPVRRTKKPLGLERLATVAVVVTTAVAVSACGGEDEEEGRSRAPSPKRLTEIASIAIRSEPGVLAVGFDSMWTVTADGHLIRIDPGTNAVTARVKVSAEGWFFAVGEGGVWVPDYEANKVRRVDPRTNKVVATIAVGLAPSGVGITPGAVWVANHHGGSVSRIDPKLNRVVARVRVSPPGTSGPQAIAAGAGAVWVGVPKLNAVVRIDPVTNRVVAKIAMPDGAPPCGGLAADEQVVWVSAGGCHSGLARVEPATNKVVDLLFKANAPELGVEVGEPTIAQGSVWFGRGAPESPVLYEFDKAGEMLSKTKLPRGAGYVTFGFGSLWLGDWVRKRVVRLEIK